MIMYRMTTDKLLAHLIVVGAALSQESNFLSKNNVRRANQQGELCS